MRSFVASALSGMVVLASHAALAATYYVDPENQNCSNSADPPTPDKPWCSIPGTRTPKDTGFVSSAWGKIAPGASTRLQCGDVILLHGGSIQSVATAGGAALQISPYSKPTDPSQSGFYSSCVGTNPIVIRIASPAEWPATSSRPASSGNFVIDCSQTYGTNTATVTFDQPWGFSVCVAINILNGLTFEGRDAEGGESQPSRIEIRNMHTGTCRTGGATCRIDDDCGSSGPCDERTVGSGGMDASGLEIYTNTNYLQTMSDIIVRNVWVHDNDGAGLLQGEIANSLIAKSEFSANEGPGVNSGMQADHPADHVIWDHLYVHHNGRVIGTPVLTTGEGFFCDNTVQSTKLIYILNSEFAYEGCNGFNEGAGSHQYMSAEIGAGTTSIRNTSFHHNGQRMFCNPYIGLPPQYSGRICSTNGQPNDAACGGQNGSCVVAAAGSGFEGGGTTVNATPYWPNPAARWPTDEKAIVTYSTTYANAMNGFQEPHSGGEFEVWNSLGFREETFQAFHTGGPVTFSVVGNALFVRNGIYVRRNETALVADTGGGQGNVCKWSCTQPGPTSDGTHRWNICTNPGGVDTMNCGMCDSSVTQANCSKSAQVCAPGCANQGEVCTADGECTGCNFAGRCRSAFAMPPDIDYTMFVPAASNTETLTNIDFRCTDDATKSCKYDSDCNGGPGSCTLGTRFLPTTFAAPARWLAFPGHHNLFGSQAMASAWPTPRWTLDPACDGNALDFSKCDFTLGSGSAAIDAGTYFMKAIGDQATASTSMTVGPSFTSFDNRWGTGQQGFHPQNYFIAPIASIGWPGDTIQIQNCGGPAQANGCRVTLTAIPDESHIMFTPAATWHDGAGVHLPWAGAAPDLGPREFGLELADGGLEPDGGVGPGAGEAGPPSGDDGGPDQEANGASGSCGCRVGPEASCWPLCVAGLVATAALLRARHRAIRRGRR